MVPALIRRNELTTSRLGSIRVRPVSTTKVRKADSSASPTANGASQRLIPPRFGSSAGDVSKDAADVSALVIPAMVMLKKEARRWRALMHSYHIVAELRQFRGARPVSHARIHSSGSD